MKKKDLKGPQLRTFQLYNGANIYIHNHCFSLSAQYLINYMRYSILYYEICFILDASAQPEAHVSILSTFKLGKAKLQWLVG